MLIPTPEASGYTRVLCVQPHYDDNDIGAGGAIAALADAGARIDYLTVADDLLGVLDPDLSDADARVRLRAEQAEAGSQIGVASQHWLDLPDGGDWDYLALRREIVRHIRRLQPELVLTCDPWLTAEAHRDHIRTGSAVAEACLMHGLPRLRTGDAEADAAEPAPLRALGLYFTSRANRFVDIAATRERKHRALDAYRSQFSEAQLAVVHAGLEAKERAWGERAGTSHAEALWFLHPAHLHCNPDADEMF